MAKLAFLIFIKDLRIIFRNFSSFAQSLLLGMVLIFVFSLAKSGSTAILPHEGATIFWLCSMFCLILVFNQLYGIEEANLARENLVLANAPVQAVWLGKLLTGFLMLLLGQAVFMPGVIIFLGLEPGGSISAGLLSLISVDFGLCAIGALIGGCSQINNARESMLSIILFPLVIPALLGGISLLAQSFGAPKNAASNDWLGLIAAFDAIFAAAALVLFGFIFRGDD